MKKIDFTDIFKMKISISDISVIYQTNLWTRCAHPTGRVFNGFLLFDRGECSFDWSDGSISASDGTLVYLPSGSRHSVTAPERSLGFYRINFTLTDLSDGRRCVFSDCPRLISSATPKNIYTLADGMKRYTLSESGYLKNLAALSELLDYMRHMIVKEDTRRIGSVIRYVESNYAEGIDVGELAGMSYLSEAHLYRLFKQETGMSPVEYRNSLRIKKAQELLLDEECSIGEISSLVGFESACYFSRSFKSHTGISPMEYRKKYKSS